MKKERLKQLDQEEREREKRRNHSDAYHRHFEGYSEFYQVDPDSGKAGIKRVYTGEYYIRDMDRTQRILLRLTLTLTWLGACVVFLLCASRPVSSNSNWYVAAAQVGCIVGLVWAAIGLANCWTVPVKMTVGDWRSSSERLRNGSVCAAVFFAVCAAATLLDYFLGDKGTGTHFICSAGFLLCCGFMILVYRLESKARYKKEQSEECAPKGAAHIR